MIYNVNNKLLEGVEMNRVSTFAERLKEYMKMHNDMSYAMLAKITGENPQTLNRYVLGKRSPKIDSVISIATKLGVSPMWLQGYDEPMIPNHETAEEKFSETELELIKQFRSLNKDGQQAAIDYMNYLTTLAKYKKCDCSEKLA
jgi:transcriptional regulator with XRE-family HTH domain